MSISESVQTKLAALKEARESAAGNFFKLQPGESSIVVIDVENDESCIQVDTEFEGKPKKSYQYVVTLQDGTQQYWQTSARTSALVEDKLAEGKLKLKIKRIGSGKTTQYTVESV